MGNGARFEKIGATLAIVLSMAGVLALSSAATAQSDMPPLERNPQITVEYRLPAHPIDACALDPDDARVANQFS